MANSLGTFLLEAAFKRLPIMDIFHWGFLLRAESGRSQMRNGEKSTERKLSSRIHRASDTLGIANFHGHALSALPLINKSMKKSITTVNVREFPEFGKLQV